MSPLHTIAAFEDIGDEFQGRIDRTVWCSMATADAQRRIRSRVGNREGQPRGTTETPTTEAYRAPRHR